VFDFRQDNKTKQEFQQLALCHVDALFASALRLTKNQGDAEDLVQDTFLRAYRFFDKFERGTNIKAWLFKILTNTFINRYRRKVKERTLTEGSELEAVHERLLSKDAQEYQSNPEQAVFDRLLSDDVLRAIDGLPDDFRMVVVLADLQEFSYREIAEIMECPVGTVMSRLYRGRRLLQKNLEGYAVELGIVKPSGTQLPSAQAVSTEVPADLAEYRRRKLAASADG
jgi:RNA polymerase sigma-70 factor, ECF subfamily